LKTPPWLKIALAEKRVVEIAGAKANPRIVEYHSVTTLRATSDEVPWCSAFACWAMEAAGVPSPASARARDWLKWGIAIEAPRPGCIVIVTRGDNPEQGHVGFWLSEDDEHVFIFGGNQGDMVCTEAFQRSSVLGYRMPERKHWNDGPEIN
jgi:uncharacterized protein (TIGR02594 family)